MPKKRNCPIRNESPRGKPRGIICKKSFSSDLKTLGFQTFLSGKPVRLLHWVGKQIVKFADSYAGVGCWRKRMSYGNNTNTGFDVTGHENVPTSNGSLIARKFGESIKWEKAKVSCFLDLLASIYFAARMEASYIFARTTVL